MNPQRIQRKRTKGWKMPEDAIYVGRPTKWGNPITPANTVGCEDAADAAVSYRHLIDNGWTVPYPHPGQSAELETHREFVLRNASELAGHDLVCWCPLSSPCHADVLLELANGGGS